VQKQPPLAPRAPARNVYWAALRDLFTPLFVISWLLTLMFFFYAQEDEAATIWILLRPLALGYLLFLGLRLFPVTSARIWLEKRHPQLARTLAEALKFFK
jgi:RsiW-degrading membrane proteinase PrsW (M82 family)